MSALEPLAERMLSQHHEFYPFGGAMGLDGKISLSSGATGSEHPNSQDLIDRIEQGFRSTRGTIKAVAILVDVRTITPGQKEKQDAIEVRLEHRANYSVRVLFPYTFAADGKVKVGQPFAARLDRKIFGP